MQDAPPVTYRQDGAVVTLTLNRPDELNAFSEAPMIDAFLACIARIEAAEDVRCVILTGAGRAFSAGGNVKHMRDRTDMFEGSPEDIRDAYLNGILRVPPRWHGLSIPTIAAINGPAAGAGLDLALMCDIRLASPAARFSTPFVKIGIAPGDGAAWYLPRLIGPQAAAEMLFTGESIGAERALEIGLVARLVDADALMAEAQALATRIAANAPLALAETKRLLRAGATQSLTDHLADCAETQGRLHHTDDHHAALAAFFEKRGPRFEGR